MTIEVVSPDELKELKINDELCKKIGAALVKTYPDRKWYVRVFDWGRVATIILHDINKEYGNTVKMLDNRENNNIKKCLTAGGEALERFYLTRGRSDNADIKSFTRNTKGDVYGSNKGEISDGRH